MSALATPWVVFGFAAQFMFGMRFVVQWIASERRRRSYVPVAFWYLSVCGGLMLLIYAIYRRDPVFMAGQSLGLVIYLRNLVLIHRRAGAYRDVTADRDASDTRSAEPSSAG
ncbi:MAG TPA: lipid-A-disaccharide synthase N-terminal domain-containing protein [Phycisphaerae bacterium]|nr:lipid-A-disaccharide synthase N-terminal domain-containing protein [Phycisphaerae bacterium]